MTSVTDEADGVALPVTCESALPIDLAPGETLSCWYVGSLPDGSFRTNTATVTTTGDVPGGEAIADVVFGAPSATVDECVDVDDTLYGPLGTVCSTGGMFEYVDQIGPYQSCGEYNVTNTAFFVASDTGAYGEDSHVVNVDVACVPIPPDDCPTGGDLGVANDYNVFVFGDFTGTNSDIQGRVAIGDDATFTNYGIGSALPAPAGMVLSVGSDLVANGGQLYAGDGDVGGTCTTTSFGVHSGTLSCADAGAFDASEYASTLKAVSAELSALAVNGTTTVHPWGGVTLSGTDSALNVFTLDLTGLSAINSLTMSVPAGSTVVVNVLGATGPLFQNMGFTLSGATYDKIVWNFEAQTSLVITGVSVPGSVLAPMAHVASNGANVEGTLIAASAEGTGQYHDWPFTGSYCQ